MMAVVLFGESSFCESGLGWFLFDSLCAWHALCSLGWAISQTKGVLNMSQQDQLTSTKGWMKEKVDETSDVVTRRAVTMWEKLQDVTGTGGEAQLVLPHQRGWAVRPRGAEVPTSVFETKEEALERGRDLARRQGTELVVFDQELNVQRRHTYA
jgi:hypothetical protein